MTVFRLLLACRMVQRWLHELGPVRMDRARRLELSRS